MMQNKKSNVTKSSTAKKKIKASGKGKQREKKVATPSWDLVLLYTSENDPQIERDITTYEREVKVFETTYRKKTPKLSEPAFLKKALEHLERVGVNAEGSRAGYYFGLRRELNAKDDAAEKRLNVLRDRLTAINNRLLFFHIALGKIPHDAQKKILSDTSLAKYHYSLSLTFEHAKHNLSESEEKILSLKANTSRSLWVSGTEKILNRRSVRFKGKSMPFGEAVERVSELPTKSRNQLWQRIIAVCKDMGEVSENELTAIVLDKKTNDELRGYPHPYSATIRGYENTEREVLALVDMVKKHYPLAHRFYALKARMLGVKKLSYADRNAAVGKEVGVPFDQATAVLKSVFQRVSPRYHDILTDMLKNGQIDALPKMGKTGGAFCASSPNLPTYVLLNYTPKMRSVMTYAHEMGHAIHAERAKAVQPELYQGHSTSVAETASTLFEQLVFDALLETLSVKERIVALHNRIQDDIATIMRQVAFFEFERDIHTTIRAQGGMTHSELATCMQKHLSTYLGNKVVVTKDDGYTYVYVSHFRNFFYVYTYVYGLLVSGAIAEKYRHDSSQSGNIDSFLTAGSSKSPKHIFRDIGIDTTNPALFRTGLQKLNARIDELERLCKQVGMFKG
jgi:oligoendopeptidase F